MERPIGRDARVNAPVKGRLGPPAAVMSGCTSASFEIGRVEVRMQYGVRIKYRLAARRVLPVTHRLCRSARCACLPRWSCACWIAICDGEYRA